MFRRGKTAGRAVYLLLFWPLCLLLYCHCIGKCTGYCTGPRAIVLATVPAIVLAIVLAIVFPLVLATVLAIVLPSVLAIVLTPVQRNRAVSVLGNRCIVKLISLKQQGPQPSLPPRQGGVTHY